MLIVHGDFVAVNRGADYVKHLALAPCARTLIRPPLSTGNTPPSTKIFSFFRITSNESYCPVDNGPNFDFSTGSGYEDPAPNTY